MRDLANCLLKVALPYLRGLLADMTSPEPGTWNRPPDAKDIEHLKALIGCIEAVVGEAE